MYSYLVLYSIVHKLLSTYSYAVRFNITLTSFKNSMVSSVYSSLSILYFQPIGSCNFMYQKSSDMPHMYSSYIFYSLTKVQVPNLTSRHQPFTLSRSKGFLRMQDFQCWNLDGLRQIRKFSHPSSVTQQRMSWPPNAPLLLMLLFFGSSCPH